MTREGWIKLYRGIMEKSIWKLSTPEQKTILIVLLMLANNMSNEWEFEGRKYTCDAGQFITSLNSIADACGKGVSVQNVRTALSRFEKLGFLTNQSTKTGRLITIVNWGKYQADTSKSNKDANKDLTKTSQSGNKDLTTNEDIKDIKDTSYIYTSKNDSQNEIDEFFERMWKLYPNKKGKGDISKTSKQKLFKLGEDKVVRGIERYKKYLEQNNSWLKPQGGGRFFTKTIYEYASDDFVEGVNADERDNIQNETDIYKSFVLFD